jgi:hypothetical protein
LGYFLLKQISNFFAKINFFEKYFVIGIFRFQKWFDIGILAFQIQLRCKYFGLFGLETVFATFSINWASFQSSGHTVQNLWKLNYEHKHLH